MLGLALRAEGWLLRFRDPLSGRDLLTHSEFGRALQESERERDEATRKSEIEAAARLQAERERDEATRRSEIEAAARLRAERERDEANRRIREMEARQRRSG